jgi:hypothetical protein
MDQQKLIEIWKVLEAVTVSLDRIGSYEADVGREVARDALYDFFSSGLFKQVASARRSAVDLIEAADPLAAGTLDSLAEDGVSVNYWSPPSRNA